jgi:formate dehydrogenase assembly factor FdhD
MLSDQAAGDMAIATAATKGIVLLSIIVSSHTNVFCDFN